MISTQHSKLFYFSLGLPLGALYWFGISSLQLIASELSNNIHLHGIISYLPFLEVIIPTIALLFAIGIFERKYIYCYFAGFLMGSLVQPFIFVAVYILFGGHIFTG